MSHISIKKGLQIPIVGAPTGKIEESKSPDKVGYSFRHYDDAKFRVLVKIGDKVQVGDPLVEDKDEPGKCFVSYVQGTIIDIVRGEKRRLETIIVQKESNDNPQVSSPHNVAKISKEELIKLIAEKGILFNIRTRPFDRIASLHKFPRTIFVKAVDTAPFAVPCKMHVMGYEKDFQTGLDALKKLTDGKVHLVYKHEEVPECFTHAQNVEKHTVSGPHPAGNVSVHIHHIDPVVKADEVVWTLHVYDVVAIGHLLNSGKLIQERTISIAGPGVQENKRGYVKAHIGHPIQMLVADRLSEGKQRLISGDVLSGDIVDIEGYIEPMHTQISVVPDSFDREFLHFFRLGKDKYTASGAYLSGHLDNTKHLYPFTTSQHGEERAFIDASVYDNVMPMRILTTQLVKAVLAEDYELAESLGLLEVVSEDFALAEFICPSKIPMMDIVRDGLKVHAKESLGLH